MIRAEPNGMNRNPQLPQLSDRLAIHAARVVAAVRHQNNRPERHRAGLRCDML